MARKRWLRGLAALALAGVPLATTVSCDGTSIAVFQQDDDWDCAFFDFFCHQVEFVDECIFGDCDDNNDIIIFD